jgi:hypothetical protein
MMRHILSAAAVAAFAMVVGSTNARGEITTDPSVTSGKLTVTPAVLTSSDQSSAPITEVQWRRRYYRPYSSWSYRPYRSYSYYPYNSYGYTPYYSYGYYPYGYSYYRPYYSGYYYPRYYTGYRGFSYYGPSFYGSFYW